MEQLVLSVPFRYQPDPRTQQLLLDFRSMLEFCLQRAAQQPGSYAQLRKLIYREFRSKFPNYASHYCHAACRVALAMLKSWRRSCRKGKADPSKLPRPKKLFIRFDLQLAKFMGSSIRITLQPREWLQVPLSYGNYQEKFIQAWRAGQLKIGEIIMNGEFVLVPFRKLVNLEQPRDWIGLDINEDCIVASDGSRFDAGQIRAIHTEYFLKRRRIQTKLRSSPSRDRILAKYRNREKNRVRDALHKLAHRIVSSFSGLGIVMENLNGIRSRISYGRMLNRRLHCWNFRRLQFYIEYKSKLQGMPVVYVDPRNTSRSCPRCAGVIAANGACCGLDRHLAAALNIRARHVGSSVPPESPAPELGRNS